jgi:hypothetical protein
VLRVVLLPLSVGQVGLPPDELLAVDEPEKAEETVEFFIF